MKFLFVLSLLLTSQANAGTKYQGHNISPIYGPGCIVGTWLNGYECDEVPGFEKYTEDGELEDYPPIKPLSSKSVFQSVSAKIHLFNFEWTYQ